MDNKYWLKALPNGTWEFGLTQEALDRLGLLWTIVPRQGNKLVKDQIFANVESSRCLGPLRSPVDATILKWNEHALECPDTITPNTPLAVCGDVK